MLSSFSADQQFILFASGPPLQGGSLPLSQSLCNQVMASGSPLIVPAVRERASLADVVPPASIEAYLGAPVRLSSGLALGTLCVTEAAPRRWSGDDLDLILDLAACLASQIELTFEVMLRENAEAALRTAQARFLAVADNIPGLVFERKKVDAARCTYTFFGARKTDLPSVRAMTESGASGDLSFIHPDDREAVRAAVQRNTIEETDLDLAFRVKEPNGSLRWLRSQSIVRRVDDGTVHWDGLCFDITDLVAAREDAEAARQEKEAALVNVSHELRTPLQAIMGFSEFLVLERQPDAIAAHARNIRVAADALLSIVNQLLDLAGAEAATVRPETVVLRDFADSCLSMVGPQATEKKLTSRLVIEDDVPAVVAVERQKLHQALLNLLNNAVKFTDEGSVTLRIARAPDGLCFSVIDTGTGIPAEKRDLLFQRFSRIEPEIRATDGTGLGLSITKTLVENMRGRIGVSQNLDRGTTFWFEIPVSFASIPIEGAVRPGGQPEPQPASSGGARILLADDLDLNRKLIADMLSIDGHVVDCVADGAAAVVAAGANSYDLILMDMIMPGMDGIAATHAIRAMPAPACTVPIVALTANSFREQLDTCLRAGMDATLTKPMSLDALSNAVFTWSRGRTKAA